MVTTYLPPGFLATKTPKHKGFVAKSFLTQLSSYKKSTYLAGLHSSPQKHKGRQIFVELRAFVFFVAKAPEYLNNYK